MHQQSYLFFFSNLSILFIVNAREAGLAELEITATSPLGHALPLQIVTIDEFTQQISFLPTVPGLYQLQLVYGGVPVHGSPLAFGVGPLGPQPPPRALGPGLDTAQVGERTSFTVSSIIQPRVQVASSFFHNYIYKILFYRRFT